VGTPTSLSVYEKKDCKITLGEIAGQCVQVGQWSILLRSPEFLSGALKLQCRGKATSPLPPTDCLLSRAAVHCEIVKETCGKGQSAQLDSLGRALLMLMLPSPVSSSPALKLQCSTPGLRSAHIQHRTRLNSSLAHFVKSFYYPNHNQYTCKSSFFPFFLRNLLTYT